MVISNKSDFPGIIFKGREIRHDSRRDVAGVIFFNDEGAENGGLIFTGSKKKNGVISSGAQPDSRSTTARAAARLRGHVEARGAARQSGQTRRNRPPGSLRRLRPAQAV